MDGGNGESGSGGGIVENNINILKLLLIMVA